MKQYDGYNSKGSYASQRYPEVLNSLGYQKQVSPGFRTERSMSTGLKNKTPGVKSLNLGNALASKTKSLDKEGILYHQDNKKVIQ